MNEINYGEFKTRSNFLQLNRICAKKPKDRRAGGAAEHRDTRVGQVRSRRQSGSGRGRRPGVNGGTVRRIRAILAPVPLPTLARLRRQIAIALAAFLLLRGHRGFELGRVRRPGEDGLDRLLTA